VAVTLYTFMELYFAQIQRKIGLLLKIRLNAVGNLRMGVSNVRRGLGFSQFLKESAT
jgi:hypothetical protein